jgi:hypothetical protein
MSGHVTVVPQCEEMEESMKGKHSPPSAGNIYAKGQRSHRQDHWRRYGPNVRGGGSKPGFQSRAHYHIKAYETFYIFDGSAVFQAAMNYSTLRKVHAFTFRPACRTR